MRFDTFDHEWEKVRLGLFVKEVKKYTSDFNKYPLFTFSIEDGVTPKTDRYERGFLVKKEGETFKIIEENQFLINPMNLRFGAINFSKIKRSVSVSGYYDIFEIEEKKNCYFWYGLLSNNKTIKLYNSIATGSLSEKKRVHFSQLVQLNFYVPNENERSRISILLNKISERIETQNKIIKKYESLIKPLFDSLNKGPKHPVTIGELGKYVSADSLSWDSINDCGNPVIIYGQLFTDYKYIIREVISRTDAILKTVTHGNDLLFPSSTTVDALSLIAPASIKLHNVFLGGDMFKIEMDIAKFDSDYISFLINCSYKEELAKYAQGSTIIHLHYDDIKSFKINICDIEEQKKISNALNLLLDKITVEKRLLELLRIQRRYLLGNMFI